MRIILAKINKEGNDCQKYYQYRHILYFLLLKQNMVQRYEKILAPQNTLTFINKKPLFLYNHIVYES